MPISPAIRALDQMRTIIRSIPISPSWPLSLAIYLSSIPYTLHGASVGGEAGNHREQEGRCRAPLHEHVSSNEPDRLNGVYHPGEQERKESGSRGHAGGSALSLACLDSTGPPVRLRPEHQAPCMHRCLRARRYRSPKDTLIDYRSRARRGLE